MLGYNIVVLAGNLTRDMELRYTPAGMAVGTTGIAVNTMMGRNNDGTPKTDTLFVDLILYGRLAESVADYMKKGKPVLIDGRLRYRTWEDQLGNKHSKHEIIVNTVKFLGGQKDGNGKPDLTQPSFDEGEMDDDDIPF